MLLTGGFCSEVPVPNGEKEKDGVLSPSYGVSSHVPSCEAKLKRRRPVQRERIRSLWYGIFLRQIGYRLRGCGLRQGRRSFCAYGGAIPGRSGLHTSAPLSRLPARPWG